MLYSTQLEATITAITQSKPVLKPVIILLGASIDAPIFIQMLNINIFEVEAILLAF